MDDESPVLNMDALTVRQREVLGMIAINFDLGHPPNTLLTLERKGFIVGHKVEMGGLLVTRWEVPVHIHIQWAQWCTRQEEATNG
jgi:hypothetical protein